MPLVKEEEPNSIHSHRTILRKFGVAVWPHLGVS
jgi:hypothetical protein